MKSKKDLTNAHLKTYLASIGGIREKSFVVVKRLCAVVY
jgi:hypothetical protein